jgi:hypothetical protein
MGELRGKIASLKSDSGEGIEGKGEDNARFRA